MCKRLMAVIATLATAITPMAIANAVPEPTTGVETLVGPDQWVGVPVEFDYAAADEGFQAQRQLRAEMWDINPPFEGKPLRVAAAEAGMTTKDAYVNGFKLDYNLSKIAVQRSVAQVRGLMHARPSGTDCAWVAGSDCLEEEKTATINGQGGWGNNLAAGTAATTIRQSVLQSRGHGELAFLRAANGVFNTNNGHLYQALNPQNKFHGFGMVKRLDSSKYTYYSATTFGWNATTGGTTPLKKGVQRVTIYRAAVKGERPTGTTTPTNPTNPLPGNIGDVLQSSEGSNSAQIFGVIAGLVSLVGLIAAIFGLSSGAITIPLG